MKVNALISFFEDSRSSAALSMSSSILFAPAFAKRLGRGGDISTSGGLMVSLEGMVAAMRR